jgi:predicted protein tyrosine phosphatase
MRFIVCSRETACDIDDTVIEPTTGRLYRVDDDFVVISFTDIDSEPAAIPQHERCKDILRLQFHDTDRLGEKFLGVELVPIAEMQAQEIWDFFKKHKDRVGTVIVHCEAGISRSAGCAAALAKAIGESDERFFKYFHPNRLVYRLVLNAAMKDNDSPGAEESV